MTYTPTTWRAGDTITSARLNRMEQGIATGGGVLMVEMEYTKDGEDNITGAVLNEYTENIVSAFLGGSAVIVQMDMSEMSIEEVSGTGYIRINTLMDALEDKGGYVIVLSESSGPIGQFYGVPGEYPVSEGDSPGSGEVQSEVNQ